MKNQLILSISAFLIGVFPLYSQVEVHSGGIDINTSGQVNELAINGDGTNKQTVYVEADDDSSQSTAIYGKAKDISTFGGFTNAIIGDANLPGGMGNRARGVSGYAHRDAPSPDGRSTGVYGAASNSTNGSNYGVFGQLSGTNTGTAILGHDNINENGWSQVLNQNVYYAGYFRGKGYFHDNLGIGQDDPKAKIHVKGGDVYLEDSANGIILRSPDTNCHRVTVDNAGSLQVNAVACPN